MSGIALFIIGLGLLMIVTRGPLLIAPDATLAVYRRVLETDGRVRVLGSLMTLMGGGAIFVAGDSGGVAGTLVGLLGWLLVGSMTLVVIPFPALYRSMAESFLDAAAQALPAIGAISAGAGIVLVWLGVSLP